MEWDYLSGFGTVTLVVIGVVIYFGVKLSRKAQESAPDGVFSSNLTLSGTALYACMVAFWIVCAAARALAPQDLFGKFLNTGDGLVTVLVASLFFVVFGGTLLEKLGYPMFK